MNDIRVKHSVESLNLPFYFPYSKKKKIISRCTLSLYLSTGYKGRNSGGKCLIVRDYLFYFAVSITVCLQTFILHLILMLPFKYNILL